MPKRKAPAEPVILFHAVPPIGEHGAGTRAGKPRALKVGKLEIPWKDLRPAPNRRDRRAAVKALHADRALHAHARDRDWLPVAGHFAESTFDLLVYDPAGDLTGVLRGSPRLARIGGGFVPRPTWDGPRHLDPRRRTRARTDRRI